MERNCEKFMFELFLRIELSLVHICTVSTDCSEKDLALKFN